jgi:hypothetical protein
MSRVDEDSGTGGANEDDDNIGRSPGYDEEENQGIVNEDEDGGGCEDEDDCVSVFGSEADDPGSPVVAVVESVVGSVGTSGAGSVVEGVVSSAFAMFSLWSEQAAKNTKAPKAMICFLIMFPPSLVYIKYKKKLPNGELFIKYSMGIT